MRRMVQPALKMYSCFQIVSIPPTIEGAAVPCADTGYMLSQAVQGAGGKHYMLLQPPQCTAHSSLSMLACSSMAAVSQVTMATTCSTDKVSALSVVQGKEVSCECDLLQNMEGLTTSAWSSCRTYSK